MGFISDCGRFILKTELCSDPFHDPLVTDINNNMLLRVSS